MSWLLTVICIYVIGIIIFIILAFIFGSRGEQGLSFRVAVKLIEEDKRRQKEKECQRLYEFESYEDYDDFDSDYDDGSYDLENYTNPDYKFIDLSILQPGQDYYYGSKVISASRRNGYSQFPIKGLNYRDLSIKDIGRFEGYAKADLNNEHDAYAIAIYRENHLHLGYLPAGNNDLYNYIINNGGYVHCLGYIAAHKNLSFYGTVSVESNKDLVHRRNYTYETTKFYDYKNGALYKFLETAQSSINHS
jgi:hypothetical protein